MNIKRFYFVRPIFQDNNGIYDKPGAGHADYNIDIKSTVRDKF